MYPADSISQTPHRAENELLLCCVRPKQQQDSHNRIRELVTGEIDWEYLFVAGRRHGVLPLFYSRLQQIAADLTPPVQLERFRKYYEQNAARNLVLAEELKHLILLFGQEDIEAIPYKGPVLALFAYEDLQLRRFVDLDIMVQKKDVLRGIDLLLTEGYELAKPLNTGQRDVLLRTQHNLQFRRHNRQLIVELHWEVASHLFASSVAAEELWKELVPIELNGVDVQSLGAEDLIFSLCIHGSRHLWERLLWICDVGWIIERHELDWEALLERARKTKAERMFLLGLQLGVKLLAVRLPVNVRKEIQRDPHLEELAGKVVEELFKVAGHRPRTPREIFEYNLKIRRSWASRARYFRHALNPTDRDLNTVALPGSLSFAYYLMRPFRLLFKVGEDVD